MNIGTQKDGNVKKNPVEKFFSYTASLATEGCKWTWKNTIVSIWAYIKKNFYNFLIPLVLLLFVGLLVGLFISYRQANQVEIPSLNAQIAVAENETAIIELRSKIYQIESWWSQVWSFCSTETFKTVAVSFLATIILAALGKLFKIKEALEERIRAQRQKRIEEQKNCIKDSEKMWDELYCMASEVRFYDKAKVQESNDNPKLEMKDRKPTIVDILKQCENFASKAEEVVNRWHFVFPMLVKIGEKSNEKYVDRFKKNITYQKMTKKEQKEIQDTIKKYRRPSKMILFFANMLYEAATSVSYHIKADYGCIPELQHALGVIQDITKDMVHQLMLSILKCAVEPLDGYEDEEQRLINKENIEKYLEGLFRNYIITRDIIYDILPLPEIIVKGSALYNTVYGFLNTMKKPEKPAMPEKQTGQKIGPQKSEAFQLTAPVTYEKLKECFSEVKERVITKDWEYKYSQETLEDLAKRLSLMSLSSDLNDRTSWLKIIELAK